MNSHWKNAEPDPAKLEVLAGWKAIAGYFAWQRPHRQAI